MVNNYDRIFDEITEEARRLPPNADINPELLVKLTMEIVDLEDQHRIRNIRINQLIREKIFNTAVNK